MEQAWLLPALPLAAFVVLLVAGPYLPRRGDWLAIAAIGASFILFFPILIDLLDVIGTEGFVGGGKSWDWISYDEFEIQLGFFVDPITIVMLIVVSTVALLVQIYSVAYM
jgi:NADH-quinone oxidoreductase subunit L